jgi:DEAD/DEAH box helicase domain-containing protein
MANQVNIGSYCYCYDGDTKMEDRAGIRKTGKVIVTNPDMLHSGILPNHKLWEKFFSNLKFVVLDEAHTYRGVFGSHVVSFCLLNSRYSITIFYHPPHSIAYCSSLLLLCYMRKLHTYSALEQI